MSIKLVISIDQSEADLRVELVDAIKTAGLDISRGPRKRGEPVVDIILTLGSAGAFTALYQIICKLLEKNKDRRLVIKYKGGEVEITGHSLPEELSLLQKIAPGLDKQKKSA